MIKKTIEYEDFDGNKCVDEAYFNMSKTELVEMDMNLDGLQNKINALIKEQNVKEVYKIFKDIVINSYGVKSTDGKRFIKSPELSKEFTETAAFDELMIELMQNTDASAEFMTGLLPADLRKQVAEMDEKDKPALLSA